MLDILVVSVFGRVNSDTNDRVNSLHDYLNFKVKIVTTDFSHRDKAYHSKNTSRNVDFLHVSSYSRNLSIPRIFSHWMFALRLLKYLITNGNKYKVIYCIIPTPSSAFICSIYKWINPQKKLIIDLIDIWPEGLIQNDHHYKWIYPLLIPWKWLSIIAFKSADALFAATEKYKMYASNYNSKAISSYYPLGIDSEKVSRIRNQSDLLLEKGSDELWICYAGNLGSSYDFDAMINSILYVNERQSTFKLKFIMIGGGDKEKELHSRLEKTNLNYIITGNIEYKDYLNYLFNCDIGFNIYSENSGVIQSYKFNDYAVAGLFVVNNLRGNTAALIEKYDIGVNLNGPNHLLSDTLLHILNDWNSIMPNQVKRCSLLIDNVLSKKRIYEKMQNDLLSVIGER